MKRFVLFFVATSCFGQVVYTASKTTALTSSAEVVTVQQPSSGALVVRFVSAFIDSTADCTIKIERDGTAASTTALTPVAANTGQIAASARAFSASNVGTGNVITRASIPAGGSIIVDLTKVFMSGSGTVKNLTVRTGSCTGTVDIVITFTEANN